LKHDGETSCQLLDLARKHRIKLILMVVVQNLNVSLSHLDCTRNTAKLQIPISNRVFRMGKEVIKNYLLKFSALIVRWGMFYGEPVITAI